MPAIEIRPEDVAIFEKYAKRVGWNQVSPEDQRRFRDIRGRLRTVARVARARYPGNTLIQDFASVLNPNGRTPRDYWCCIYPVEVPNKSFGLQIALIVGPKGCEVCFCLGAGTSQERDPEKIRLNRIALDRAKAGLSSVPAELRQTIDAACRQHGWTYRRSWRESAGTGDFRSIGEWLAFASSAQGDAATISQNISVDTLSEDPEQPIRVFEEAGQLFAPLLDYVYGQKVPSLTDEDAAVIRVSEGGQGEQGRASDSRPVRYWLLAAGGGARLWPDFQENGVAAIGWDDLGDLSRFDGKEEIAAAISARWKTENPVNDALACYQFAHDIASGDYVYVKRGRSEIIAYGVITSDYRFAPDRSEYKNVRDVDWLAEGPWSLPEGKWLPQKALTEIGPELVNLLENLRSHRKLRAEPVRAYKASDALAELFIEKEELDVILDVLARKKNLILTGPPGVGKTFAARRIAYVLMGECDPDRIKLVQFHQSLSYEDFVQGWRPTRQRGFVLRAGPFLEFAELARADQERTHVLIIDEINRGNLGKIFGELLMLLEADKRDRSYAVPLTYAKPDDPPFIIPPNLYTIGMMNTADRSLAMVDYALRRRFGFAKMRPRFESQGFRRVLSQSGASDDLINRIVHRITSLNGTIAADQDLGEGFLIGHSYFLPTGTEDSIDEQWFRRVVGTDVIPLLEEYWFDKHEQVVSAQTALLA